ncbi:hypothetical protein ABPG73_016927 [Tetrahymena malaccensis]
MIIQLIGCILFLNLQFWAKAQGTSIEGCISYQNNNSNTCTQCDEYFELNQQKNVCIYKKCGNSQYYEQYSNIITDDKKCVAICSPLSWRNQETNLCQKQEKCTTQVNAELNTDLKHFKDIFVYQNIYYVVQTDYFMIYNKTDLSMIKTLNYQQNDQLVLNLNSDIFIIILSNQDENLNIESNFLLQSKYSGSYFDILSTSQLNIYILAQDDSIQLINLNNNQTQLIKGRIDNQNILQVKIFQGFNIDSKEYLIISTLYQLVCISIETNSQSLTITDDYIINFEVFYIQGNQSQGFLIREIKIGATDCQIYPSIVLCQSQNQLTFIDRFSFDFSQASLVYYKIVYAYYLDLLLVQIAQQSNYISIFDIAGNIQSQIFSARDYPNQQIKAQIIDYQYDYSSRSVIYFDQFGTIYLFSLDKNYPFQSYIQITEIIDSNITLNQNSFRYNNITNNIYLDNYVVDYDTLGWQYEPQFNEPYNYFSKIVINNLQTDYLIFNKYNNTIFRYSNKILKYELDVSGSTIQDMQYNQISDILIIGLENSLLFYEQYQQSKNKNIYPHIQKFDNIQFQQFISDNLIITCDKQILHLDILNIQIVNTIQFNLTQQVTSYSLSKNQNNLVVGFSNGEVLSYNLINQAYFIFGIYLNSSMNTPINFIQFKTTIDTQSIVYVVLSNAILYQIDILNNQIIEQTDLKALVNEDPNLILNKFLIDETYQRYIFCFIGHKNAYVWNFQKQKQEKYLFMPSQLINKLNIEKNYIFIQCYFQINIFQLDQKIKFLTVIKKNFLKDQITDLKLVSTNALLISFKKKIELFLINNTNTSLVGQHNYTNPFIKEYLFDIQTNELKIIGFHQTGIFENSYSLDFLQSDQEQSCNLLISSSGNNIKNEITYIYPIKTPIESVDGVTLVDKQNQQDNIYLQIQGYELRSLFDNTIEKKDYQLIVSSKDMLNNIVPLQNDTFSNLFQTSLQLANFNFDFQNYTNLLVNVTNNTNTQQVIFQNISFSFQCFGSNQIIIANIEKIVFQGIKISYQDLKECADYSQQNSLFYFYNISQIFIYELEVSNNNFYQTSQIPIFQFEIANSIFIQGLNITQNTNLNSLVSFLNVQNDSTKTIKLDRTNKNKRKFGHSRINNVDSFQQFV